MDKSSLKYLQYTKACSIEDIWYYTKACSIEDIWYLRRVYLTPAEVHWSLTVGPSASGHLCGGKGFRTDRLLCIGKGERTDRLLCMGKDWWASFVLTSHESMPESWVFFQQATNRVYTAESIRYVQMTSRDPGLKCAALLTADGVSCISIF
jgi:hypothetical protein